MCQQWWAAARSFTSPNIASDQLSAVQAADDQCGTTGRGQEPCPAHHHPCRLPPRAPTTIIVHGTHVQFTTPPPSTRPPPGHRPRAASSPSLCQPRAATQIHPGHQNRQPRRPPPQHASLISLATHLASATARPPTRRTSSVHQDVMAITMQAAQSLAVRLSHHHLHCSRPSRKLIENNMFNHHTHTHTHTPDADVTAVVKLPARCHH